MSDLSLSGMSLIEKLEDAADSDDATGREFLSLKEAIAIVRQHQAEQNAADINVVHKAEQVQQPASSLVEALRADGWAVAVHNDYRLKGEPHTFWLFTKDDSCAKGEGKTDAEALAQVKESIVRQHTREPDISTTKAITRCNSCGNPIQNLIQPTERELSEPDVEAGARAISVVDDGGYDDPDKIISGKPRWQHFIDHAKACYLAAGWAVKE